MAMNLSFSSSNTGVWCSKASTISKLFHCAAAPHPHHHHVPQTSSRFVMTLSTPSQPSWTNVRRQLPQEKLEICKSLEMMSWADENLLRMLKPVEESWQPQDLLPDPTSEEFYGQVKELRARAADIPDDCLVCLIGNMITEEALPTYQTVINTVEGFRDETGASPTPWARWTRAWTAEENRHGDVLNKYLYLSGRCDMRQVEKTIQYLLGSGMDNGIENNVYCGTIYASFQERATFTSHGNTARLAKRHGDATLAKICGLIAADERRHEMAYTKLAEMLFQLDPDGMVRALATMMRKRIRMPALLMFDGQDRSLFVHFAAVSQRLGVYTTGDYADMVEFFAGRWNVAELRGLSGEGRAAQEFVCGLAERFRKMEEKAAERAKAKGSSPSTDNVRFSWIFDRPVMA